MPVYRASGLFNCGSASPGLQACVDPENGSFRPKLIWLLPLYVGTANNCYWHRGFVAEDANENLTQWAIGIRSGDNQSSAAVRVARYTDRAWVQVISSGLGCDGTVAIEATGFTPTVSTTNGTVDVAWVALGGDVEEAVCVAVDIESADADGTVPVEVGFAPDVVIAATPAVSANNNSTATGNSSACFGWATRADTAAVSYAQRRVHGADPTTTWSSSDAVLFQSLTSTVGFTATVGAWNEDGVDLAITGTPALSSQWLYLVLARGGEWRTVTTTGDGEATQAVAVEGVDPVAVMAQSWGRAPSANVIDGDILSSFGIAADGGQQASEWGSDADAVGTTQADGTYTTDSLIYIGTVNAPATVQAEAAVSSFGAEALHLAWNPVDSVGRELQFLLVGNTSAPLEAIEGTVDAVAPAAKVSARDSNEVSGSADVTAPAAKASASGAPYTIHVPVGGVVLSGGPGLVQTVVGEAAVTAPAADADASGSSTVTAEAAASAPAADAAASGTSTVTGSAAAEAAPAQVSASDDQDLTGHVTATAPAAQADAAGAPVIIGTADAQGAPATASAAGAAHLTGQGDASAPASEAAAVGTPVLTGTADAQAPAARVAASDATDGTTGTADAVAPAATVSAAGTSTVGGAADVEAPAALVQAAGVSTITGSADVTAPAAQVEAAEIPPVIPAAILLGGPITQRRIRVGTITQRGQQAS